MDLSHSLKKNASNIFWVREGLRRLLRIPMHALQNGRNLEKLLPGCVRNAQPPGFLPELFAEKLGAPSLLMTL